MDAVHPEDREKLRAAMAEHAEGKWHIEYRIRKPDGSQRWIYDRGFPVYNERRKLCFMVGTATDITEAKNAEEELTRKNEELQSFSYVASHDLQEPLRKVTTFASILKEEYAGTLDDQGKDFIGRMVEATKRMQTLLTSLLQYSRIGWDSKVDAPVDLNEVVREAFQI